MGETENKNAKRKRKQLRWNRQALSLRLKRYVENSVDAIVGEGTRMKRKKRRKKRRWQIRKKWNHRSSRGDFSPSRSRLGPSSSSAPRITRCWFKPARVNWASPARNSPPWKNESCPHGVGSGQQGRARVGEGEGGRWDSLRGPGHARLHTCTPPATTATPANDARRYQRYL